MLRVFLSLILVSSTKGLAESERYLDAPEKVSVTAIQPSRVFVQWSSVCQRDDDPVIGYKIILSKVPESSETQAELINADEFPALVRNDKALQDFRINNTNADMREIIVDADSKNAIVDVKYNTLYEIRVLAFKIDVNGPLSEPMRIKLLDYADYFSSVTRTLTGCQISVRTEAVAGKEKETYPFIYNSFF
ncbi:unnamed protein product [Colias eurytheme]|nr:unnamed protein product [Colias eurytheme]